VGCGIVPENAVARAFRDLQGWVNQTIARAADEVWHTVAGIPVRIKG
jgi:adenosylcobinamide kinase/adenosylcobinamide-phosphate guanylyltransferase